jgi:hypothetical protein
MFRRVIFDRAPEVQARDVVRDDAPVPPLAPRPRPGVQRPTLSILRRPMTSSRDSE